MRYKRHPLLRGLFFEFALSFCSHRSGFIRGTLAGVFHHHVLQFLSHFRGVCANFVEEWSFKRGGFAFDNFRVFEVLVF